MHMLAGVFFYLISLNWYEYIAYAPNTWLRRERRKLTMPLTACMAAPLAIGAWGKEARENVVEENTWSLQRSKNRRRRLSFLPFKEGGVLFSAVAVFMSSNTFTCRSIRTSIRRFVRIVCTFKVWYYYGISTAVEGNSLPLDWKQLLKFFFFKLRRIA